MLTVRTRRTTITALCLLGPILAAGYAAARRHRGAAPPTLHYRAASYGGFDAATAHSALRQPSANGTALAAVETAYAAGHYEEARRLADGLRPADSEPPMEKKRTVAARLLAAYATAREGDFRGAREQFATVRDLAEPLPDHGARPLRLGIPEPTLEEEAAFQHAVCTLKVEGGAEAESEWKFFMERYPQSILVHAAMKRTARLHHGDVPAETERVWKHAVALQVAHDRARRREASLCGPACLAEALRLQTGKRADTHALAAETGASDQGTTMLAIARAARRRGLSAQGLRLTPAGLRGQKLPLMARVRPAHFVLVESASGEGVDVYDPVRASAGNGIHRHLSWASFSKEWTGAALTLSRADVSSRGGEAR